MPGSKQQTEREKVAEASEYARAFKAAFGKAASKSKTRIADGLLLPFADRMSQQLSDQSLSPWLCAQIDVYELMVRSLPTDLPNYFPVADIGQTSHRGAVCLQGTLPSMSTSSRLFAYPLKRLRMSK